MSDKKSVISQSLGIDDVEDKTFQDDIFEMDIPDDPELQDIIKFSLEAYKEQMEDIRIMEPKYRPRALEVAQMYLFLAKDAMVKKQDLAQKDEKLDIERLKASPKEDKPTEGKFPRASIIYPDKKKAH